jgi:hypothetical protein
MWFSNVQALNGEIPDVLFSMLPKRLTLQQGMKSVADQFEYSVSPVEQDHLLYFASFNKSFAVAGVAARDRTVYLDSRPHDLKIFSPGDFLAKDDKPPR